MKRIIHLFCILLIATGFLTFITCNRVLPWPDAPVIPVPRAQSNYKNPELKSDIINRMAGHYAHYDVVSYEDNSGRAPVRSFIMTYGFTDFFIQNEELYEKDTFLHAENRINQTSVSSRFSDEATRAIKPRTVKVELLYANNAWHIYRPSTPIILGMKGDNTQPLVKSNDLSDYTDPDTDGHPGVTVHIRISNFIDAELYIIRREIFEYHFTIIDNNTLYGNVIDNSEQHILGATLKALTESTQALQHADKNMSLILLRRIPDEIDTWEELATIRNEIFPAEPDFR